MPDAIERAQIDLAGLCSWAVELVWQAGASPRAVEPVRRAIELEPPHAALRYERAAELVISVKTASVHVSHILRKLDAPNRREAAAIAHRHRRP